MRGVAAALALLLALSLLPLALAQEVKGPAVDRIIFRGLGSQDIAEQEIRAGNIDLFFYNLKSEAARALRARGDLTLVEVPSSTVSIVLNPAPAPSGELNPFSMREVRYAMQFLVDREAIATRFYGGLAMPMYTHVSPTDFDHLTIRDVLVKRNIRYDPEYARQLVSDAMRKAGAELKDGVWHYNGRPVTVRVIIRPEDERREIGLAFAAELRRLGFNVEEVLLEFGPAIQRVYSTDPRTFAWHAYTEGWARGGIERYDSTGINQFCAPWLGNMPGWKEVGFWQYENPEIDALGQRIFRGEFRDLEERNQLYRRTTELCLDESVRVWVVTVVNAFPVSRDVRNLITDLVAGVRSPFSLREAYVEGGTSSGSGTSGSTPRGRHGTRSVASATSTASTSGVTSLTPASSGTRSPARQYPSGRASRSRPQVLRDPSGYLLTPSCGTHLPVLGRGCSRAPRRGARSPSTCRTTSGSRGTTADR